jgi:hypothetical protein
MRNYWHGAKTQERKDYYQQQYTGVLKALLPYERPRVQVVKVKSDADNQHIPPEEMARSLAKMLTEEELALLDKISLKLVAPTTIDAQAAPVDTTAKPGKRR